MLTFDPGLLLTTLQGLRHVGLDMGLQLQTAVGIQGTSTDPYRTVALAGAARSTSNKDPHRSVSLPVRL